LELNKLFLKQTIIAINKLIPNLQKKINIFPDEINFPHKIEDIKNIRKDLFEEEFNMKKKHFDDTMRVEKPNIINFSDDYTNQKIVNMEQLLNNKNLERNLQIETNITDITDINNMLENIENKKNNEEITIHFDEITNEITNENIKNKNKNKKVNFNLKDDEDEEINIPLKTTIYEEQQSIKLPTDFNTINKQISQDISKNIIPSQFLPMNEFVKKINDLNTKINEFDTKINNLTNMVEILINLLKHQEG